jgi:hypothetical protein
MRTLTVVSIELDDTNIQDKEILITMKTTTGKFLKTAIKDELVNKEVNY